MEGGKLKHVAAKTKYHEVSSFSDMLFAVETIERILATFYNTAIVRRRFAEIVSEMRVIHRKTSHTSRQNISKKFKEKS